MIFYQEKNQKKLIRESKPMVLHHPQDCLGQDVRPWHNELLRFYIYLGLGNFCIHWVFGLEDFLNLLLRPEGTQEEMEILNLT